jgi:hypothetical protein
MLMVSIDFREVGFEALTEQLMDISEFFRHLGFGANNLRGQTVTSSSLCFRLDSFMLFPGG